MKMKPLVILLALSLASNSAHAAYRPSAGRAGNFLHERDPKMMIDMVQFVFRSGSFHDPAGKEGLARLSFLSLLRGTKKLTREEFIQSLEELGASATVDTKPSRSILTLTVIRENLEPALDLVAQAILAPGLRDEEIRNLLDEELASLSMEKASNRQMARRAFLQTIYRGTPFQFPPEGTPDSLARITPKDVKAFLGAHLRSDNLIVAAAGNRSEGEIAGLVRDRLAPLAAGKAPAPRAFSPAPIRGRHLVLVPRKGSATTEVLFGHRGFRAGDPDWVPLQVGMFVFGSEFTSRLSEVLRKQNGWTYGAYGFYTAFDSPRRHGGTFLMYAFPQAQYTHLLMPKALQLFEEYVEKGVTKEELRFAAASLSKSYPFELADAVQRLNRRLYQRLDGAPFPGLAEMRRLLKATSREAVLRAARKIHDSKNLVIVLAGDPDELEKTRKALGPMASEKEINDPMKALP
ncbi:MAG: insulinase family protein [Bdellovibrionales bacterium]|nr:insulinase family protein [Bdellovibrionales bacterium]